MEYVQHISKHYSKGILPRLNNMISAAKHQADVNHVTGDEHFLALFLKGNKTVLTIHDCRFLEHPNPLFRVILKLFWLTLPVRKAKYITVVSEKTRLEVLKNSTADPGKIQVIPNFVFGHLKRNDEYTIRKKPVILQIGVTYNKNIDRVAEALSGIDCELVIVGKPSDEQIKILNDNCIQYKILAGISNEEVYQQYCNCNMVMFASTLEGFGLPIIEANTVGRPVITSNIEPMTSVANDAACFVDPYSVDSIRNAVIRIINDHAYRDQLVQNGFVNSKRFSIETVADQYHRLYQKVLAGNKAA